MRYHLDLIPNAVDLSTWRLSVEGNVERPLQVGFEELVKSFKAVSVVTTLNPHTGDEKAAQVSLKAYREDGRRMGSAGGCGMTTRKQIVRRKSPHT